MSMEWQWNGTGSMGSEMHSIPEILLLCNTDIFASQTQHRLKIKSAPNSFPDSCSHLSLISLDPLLSLQNLFHLNHTYGMHQHTGDSDLCSVFYSTQDTSASPDCRRVPAASGPTRRGLKGQPFAPDRI